MTRPRHIPAPWTWFPPKKYRTKTGCGFTGWGFGGPQCKWRPPEVPMIMWPEAYPRPGGHFDRTEVVSERTQKWRP